MDGAAASPELEVRLLGPVEARRAGEHVVLGGQKPRTLLAVLALEPGRVVSVDRLVEALWPSDPPKTSSHALQVYVSQLRKTLGAVIATHPPGYVLELTPASIDVHNFRRLAHEGKDALEGGDPTAAEAALREALALWRGPALADFVYEPFAQADIARLEELRTLALEARIDADLALGRHAELVPELEALVQAQPLRERPRAQLMLALYRSGRQADALAAYRAARTTLVEELGLDPGSELKELEAAILRQDETLLLPEAPPGMPAMQFRRLSTILFCNLVDSLALAGDLDPEALGRLLGRYFDTVSAALVRHGGTVESYAGDAVMGVFGIPVSHEDDALRAVRAAIDIRTAVAALAEQVREEHGVALEIRIGIVAGEVLAMPSGGRQRFVAGEAVGLAARVEEAAEPGAIFVGEVVARLIDHAARLAPAGSLRVESRPVPFRVFRLEELTSPVLAFERSLDAPLVGRKRELAALRRARKRASDRAGAEAAFVVGAPGVGKSRLAVELVRRARGATALWGRCLPYGDGITYWPLREMLEQAAPRPERDSVLAAFDAEMPPPAAEVALLFRRFCEVSAQERPLILVFDDVHWAVPTLLDLVEHLVDQGSGPITVVCLARDDLLESRPSFLDGRVNAERIVVYALSDDEADALFVSLGGDRLESDQRARVVGAAEGNPFFLEQLLALALEGGLAEGVLPPTVRALLAARLDRLGPGERAVLERAAVVGKGFTSDDVAALIEPEAVPTLGSHLHTLSERGFVRPDRGGVFAFRHALARDAVYSATPKRLRAALHERYADRLDSESPDLPDLDEFVGYHLERAYRLRTELGEADRQTVRLAEDSGLRLGDAGVRALKRGDIPASRGLLVRATALLPPEYGQRAALLQDLGIVLEAAGQPDAAIEAHEEAVEAARRAGDRATEVSARVELAHLRLPRTPGSTADALLEATQVAIPVLEAAGDHRRVGRALLFEGWAHGGRRGQQWARLDAAERALIHYRQTTWPLSTCVGEIANALYYGPTPVPDAIARCDELLATAATNRYGRANLGAFVGGLVAQQGDFDRARAHLESARVSYAELGHGLAHGTFSGVLGDVELLADDPVAAEGVLRSLCADLAAAHAYSRLASRAGDLAEALYRQGRLDEATRWIEEAEAHSASDDLDAKVLWMPVAAKLAAARRDFAAANALGREAVQLAETGDALNRTAKAKVDLAEVLRLSGDVELARRELRGALALLERKSNVVEAARVEALLGAVTAAR